MTIQTPNKPREYTLSGWDLSELLPEPTEALIEERLGQIEETVLTFEGLRDKLSPEMNPEILVAAVRQYETLIEQAQLLSGYGGLWFSADTQSPDALTFRNRMQQVFTETQNRTLFFSLWWKSLDDEQAARLLPDVAEQPDYRHYLEEMRLFKPYTLDEKSEQLINTKDANGMNALLTIYSMLTNRLEFDLTVDGETKKVTRGELMAQVYSPNPDARAAAYQELYRVYGAEANILAQIYVNRVRDWASENVDLRKFDSPIAVRNLDNDIPAAAVDALLDVARKNAPLFQRYFRLKAGWLGMEKLRRYDIYAPLAQSDKTVEYGAAARSVLETFASFDEGIAAQAQRVFDDNHIDSQVRKGKRGGAFCATLSPKITPYVLMNWTGKVRDVATLAHELGHAIHSMQAEHHSLLTQHSSLPLAETASVFAEMVMTDKLLAQETDPAVRRDILAGAVDDIYATVMRQAYFVLFEKEAHAAILQNKSPKELNAIYMANLAEQFGDSVEVGEEFQHEWVSIPHIYSTPFYCYAYSFGQLLVLALYRRYQQEGDAFKPGYLKILAYGGSARPETILREAGIAISDPAFWQGGFDVIREMIDELASIPLD
ncbi:MAG: M3 family oligoendopeptidase [Chloroflexi bacterium]|nr:MAG: M3 family oligoendopeptidase [Chloroflexota bacterium]